MAEPVLLATLLGASWLGWAWLALSQARHWRQAVGLRLPGCRQMLWLRAAGAALLGTALVLALLRDGPAFGALLWAIAISFTAMAVVFILAWQPGWLRWLAPFR
ncbi:uncharacterized protein FOKN1_1144 [Thiohalobacter thiocyanaticus]|uniref:DUF3325 domain-containing protein n=1 Tax=Thiohalobacter thiocyanaticus TaxID=585455 RepID=A0A1Z4VPX7_9GAMM|nr:DUF3325 domain-containing protein [Thiohalobacter thiocyanaticus]BAZ93543.1 uncharacterized protein FOKN1_1144 [Thiohalobacter thiocyanaticus]